MNVQIINKITNSASNREYRWSENLHAHFSAHEKGVETAGRGL